MRKKYCGVFFVFLFLIAGFVCAENNTTSQENIVSALRPTATDDSRETSEGSRQFLRGQVFSGIANWQNWNARRDGVLQSACQLLGIGDITQFSPTRPIQPIIVAAGKGTRAKDSGLAGPRSLSPILGKPAIEWVLDAFRGLPFYTQPPIVVVSPDNKEEIEEALTAHGYEARYIVQERPLGTGDAVLQAQDALKDFQGDTVVIWGDQAVVTPQTLLESIVVHQALGDVAMTVPTAVKDTPYAPLLRGADGFVAGSRETRMGQATVEQGEDNIGAFICRAQDMVAAGRNVHERKYNESGQRYDETPNGEFGFPNEMVAAFNLMGHKVAAIAHADPAECQGVKEKAHITVCARAIRTVRGLTIPQVYGDDATLVSEQTARYHGLVARFIARYGPGPAVIVRVPARFNIIGEHVDYLLRDYLSGGVLPFGSREYDMVMVYRPRQDGQVTMISTDQEFSERSFRTDNFVVPASEEGVSAEQRWIDFLASMPVPERDWQAYVEGAYCYLKNANPGLAMHGVDALVDSTIPVAGGASSSSALTVAAGYAARKASSGSVDLEELASGSAQAEWFVGTRGGAMDQTTISLCEPDSALLISFAPVATESVPLPKGYKWVTFFTTKHAGGSQLTSEYNERSSMSRFVVPAVIADLSRQYPEEFARIWSQFHNAVHDNDVVAAERLRPVVEMMLRKFMPETLTLAQIQRDYPRAYAEIAAEREGAYKALFEVKGEVPLRICHLSLHHVGSAVRTIKAARIMRELEGVDEHSEQYRQGMAEIGALINEEHESLRDLYDISTPDIERVRRIALRQKGVVGARVMGGGFGGNVLVCVKEENVRHVIAAVTQGYYRREKRDPWAENAIRVTSAGVGASTIIIREAAVPVEETVISADHGRSA